MTLLQDLVDGQGYPTKDRNAPNDGDQLDLVDPVVDPVTALVTNTVALTNAQYGQVDQQFDHVKLPQSAFKDFAEDLTSLFAVDGGDALTDQTIYGYANAMIESRSSATWCERCAVLALHSPKFCSDSSLPQCHDPADPAPIPEFRPTVRAVLDECIYNRFVSDALLTKSHYPPEPSGRVDFVTCTACAPNEISDEQGRCVACPTGQEVHGNSCGTCTADVVIDGAALTVGAQFEYDPTVTYPGDTCPEFFWVQVNNPQAIPAGGSLTGSLTPSPMSQPVCERAYQMSIARPAGSGFSIWTVKDGAGMFSCPTSGGLCVCQGVPSHTFSAGTETQPIRFGLPSNDGTKHLLISAKQPIQR
jgi:hypothetical protein